MVEERLNRPMLSLERRQRIVTFLARHGSGTIGEMSQLFGVSEMTIRRDLDVLEAEKVVRRTHGGAMFVESSNGEFTFATKMTRDAELKDRIAAVAARQFVHDDAAIILEGGTTVTSMARYLGEFHNLTVLTNGLQAASQLTTLHPSSTVMVCGGMLRTINLTLVGPVTADFFKRFGADLAFFSAIGFTLEQGFTDANVLESQAKVDMRRAAKKAIMLLDSTKYGVRALTSTFTLSDIDVLVTDNDAPLDLLEHVRAHGVEVLVAGSPQTMRPNS